MTNAFDRPAVQTLKQPTPQYTCYDKVKHGSLFYFNDLITLF